MLKVFTVIITLLTIIISSCDFITIYTKKEYMDLWEKKFNKLKKKNSQNDNPDPIYIPIPIPPDHSDDPVIPENNAIEIINGTPNNINYCFYEFSNNYTICKKNRSTFILNTDYALEQPLNNGSYNIYDLNNNNSLSEGKYFRILYDNINIANAGGLNLTPVAKDLSVSQSTPPSNQIYIDPKHSMFELPRPVYWSKCESVYNLVNPEIKDGNRTPEFLGAVTNPGYIYVGPYSQGFEFNNGIGSGLFVMLDPNGLIQESNHILYPFGNISLNNDSYTISFWHYGYRTNDAFQWFNYIACGNVKIIQTNNAAIHLITLYINGNLIQQHPINNNGSTNHYCIVIDKNKNLANGESIAVYMNNTKILSSSNDIDTNGTLSLLTEALHTGVPLGGGSFSIYDNIKIWNENLDPTIINSMGNIENALHPIYGSANGYKPSSNLRVSYYYSN